MIDCALLEELVEIFSRGIGAELPEAGFRELALRAFRHQAENNSIYARFLEGRGIDPGEVARWEDVPAVPARAFKALPIISGEPDGVAWVFRTSGTSAGRERRGEHHLLDLSLYHASLLPNFRAHLLPDDARLPILSLIPPPADLPDSSLSHMTGVVMERLGGEGGGYFIDPEEGIHAEALAEALSRAERDRRPLLLMSTAFALVHWLDAMEERGWCFALPDGSRIMETGGFKGRSRVVPRAELYGRVRDRLGIGAEWIVNEYGMTELLSQFYEPVLRETLGGETGPRPLAERFHRSPPWVRTRVLDPLTLAPLPPGGRGGSRPLRPRQSGLGVLHPDGGLGNGDGGGRLPVTGPDGARGGARMFARHGRTAGGSGGGTDDPL